MIGASSGLGTHGNWSNLGRAQLPDLREDLDPLVFRSKLLSELFEPSATSIMEDAETVQTITRSVAGNFYRPLNGHTTRLHFSRQMVGSRTRTLLDTYVFK